MSQPTQRPAPAVILDDDRATVIHGSSEDALALLPDCSVDALVTDPPAGIAFMAKGWDEDKGGRDAWVAWLAGILRECLRVLKPGAHGLLWALPRTSHWTATAADDAGLEVRDVLTHLFGTGFPKSLNVSKAIDAALGASADRPVIGELAAPRSTFAGVDRTMGGSWQEDPKVTVAATAAAAAWEGWGTALKPAAEHWILVRKPLGNTVAGCVMAHGTGALNVDACRIGEEMRFNPPSGGSSDDGATYALGMRGRGRGTLATGRWPANVVLSHDSRCVVVGTAEDTRPCHDPEVDAAAATRDDGSGWAMSGVPTTTTTTTTTIHACVPGCAVRALDVQSGADRGSHGRVGGKPTRIGYKADAEGTTTTVPAGSASRFFYCAKPSKAEAEAGLDHLPVRTGGEATDREDGSDGLNSPRAGAGRRGGRRNVHPTKKSVALMRYFVRLITPPGGVVLDPFAGSGATAIAALAEGARFVGVEQGGPDDEYLPILLGRVRHALDHIPEAGLPAGAPWPPKKGNTPADPGV